MKRLTHQFEDDRLNDNFSQLLNDVSSLESSVSSLQTSLNNLSSQVETGFQARPVNLLFQATLSSAQSIPSGTLTKVTFDSVVSELGALSSGTWTAPYGGVILCLVKIQTANDWSGYATARLELHKNGSAVRKSRIQKYDGKIAGFFSLEEGDRLDVHIYQDGGSSQTIRSGFTLTAWEIYYLYRR